MSNTCKNFSRKWLGGQNFFLMVEGLRKNCGRYKNSQTKYTPLLQIQTMQLLINSELEQYIKLYWIHRHRQTDRPVRNKVKHLWILIWLQGTGSQMESTVGSINWIGDSFAFYMHFGLTNLKFHRNCTIVNGQYHVTPGTASHQYRKEEGNQTSSIRYAFETGKVSKTQGKLTLSLY